MSVFVLEQRQRIEQWTGDWVDDVETLGHFTSQEAAVRWLRKSRRWWGDREPLMPEQHPSGCTPPHPFTPCCSRRQEAICAWISPDGIRCVADRDEPCHTASAGQA